MNKRAALADFETARKEWEAAFADVPDGALTYLKPGDDYALGGLQVHVNWVLTHYSRILDGIVANGFGPLDPLDKPAEPEAANRKAKAGLAVAERKPSVEEMERLHSSVLAAAGGVPDADWSRKAPVVYGAGQDPYETSTEDILGWLTDHYREHVQQSADLVAAWERTA